MIFLSPRDWLAQWPRRLQLFAVALLLLAGVAQNWHVCALGGHALGGHALSGHDMTASPGAHGGHGAKKFKILTNADGTPGPVICACAHEDEPGAPTVSPTPAAHQHVTCLALLLQTMPLQIGVPFVLNQRETVRPFYATRAQVTPAFASPLAVRGRAPPIGC